MTCLEKKLKTTTLLDILHHRATYQPEQIAYTFLVDGEKQETHLTYQELDTQAKAVATYLQSFCLPGERALLLYPPGLEYIVAFFACLYAGVIAVPAYPPKPNRSLSRLQTILEDAQAKVALTTHATFSALERGLEQTPGLKTLQWIATDRIPVNLARDWQEMTLQSNNLAFLQYTSGSTAEPKGVAISHDNILHNLNLIHQCFQHSPKSKGVIWLPPYHDMGLIGGILQPLYGGFPVVLMSPLMFLQSPIRWLKAISDCLATTSGGPNFAYELCINKIKPEQLVDLDLSTWDLAFNGAEPINDRTLERFAAKFKPCGFRAEAFYPCYGMAEATLIVSGGLKKASIIKKVIQAEQLEQNLIVPASLSQEKIRTVVGCGQNLPEQEIVIVEPENLNPCPTGKVGEIWVKSPSVAQGYWGKPEATVHTFHAYLADRKKGPFLRTGDLGFLSQEGELFVTGRLKDVIIINGRNFYPQDIERTIEQSHVEIRPSCCASFSIDLDGEEKLIIMAELDRRHWDLHKENGQDLSKLIRRTVSQHHELQVYRIIFLKPGRLPKTSSGKIQRHACRNLFLEEQFAQKS